ncbi:hypothetical protein J2T18_004751 [Paenibacillus polymyxa]|uniref:DUF5823 family protein n=1 Tax=Paenibacillus polymyxa TaxID=1406 RepID=UPI00278DE7B1|nr:DUF5823 family protein [Paenibacillus polymyxa]MDQ0050412.1 hypothetical protein [Paenibacillus polymyxa]
MFILLKEIITVMVGLITDFLSFQLDAYFYIWFLVLFISSLAATLVQRSEGTITYSTAECVGINVLVIVLYLVIGTILARYFASFEDQQIVAEDKIMLYKISFMLTSAVIIVDIILDRLKRGRKFSYSLEFLAGSAVCFLLFQLSNQTDWIGTKLSLSYIVMVAIAAGVYTMAMKFLLEYENHKEK